MVDYLFWEWSSSVPGRSFGLPSPQQQMLALLCPVDITQPCIIQALCCSRRLFITHQRLWRFKPRMPPSVLHYRPHPATPSKDHLLAAHESVREGNRPLLGSDICPFSISAAAAVSLLTPLFRNIWWGWRSVPPVSMERLHLSFMTGNIFFEELYWQIVVQLLLLFSSYLIQLYLCE